MFLGAGMATPWVTAAGIRAADGGITQILLRTAGGILPGRQLYGGGLYGQPWGYSHSSGYLPGYGAYFGSSYYGSGFGYSSYGGFCR